MKRLWWMRMMLRMFRRPVNSRPFVLLQWGTGELECEMVALDALPRVGDRIDLQLVVSSKDPQRWRVEPATMVHEVVSITHAIEITYGEDVGPNTFQQITVFLEPADAATGD